MMFELYKLAASILMFRSSLIDCIQYIDQIYRKIQQSLKMGGKHSKHFDPTKLSADQKKKLQQGKPLQPIPGVKIVKNPKTGKLQGVPQEWVKNYDLPMQVDFTKTVKTAHFSQQIRPDSQLPDSILDLINSQPIFISKPTNFQHKIHLQVDLKSQYGIKGLTPEMMKMFDKNDITPNQIKENPQAFISILHGLEKENEVPQNELMTDSQFKKQVQKVQFIPNNPNQVYRFAKQLGKGAMCTVYEAYHRKHSTECVAVRVMKVPDQQMLQKIKIQAAVMSMCANKNIVNYISSYYYMNCLFMLIEFMDGGSLTDIVYGYTKKIPENISAYIMREILQGLDFIHDKKQIHRDLKSDNILVDKKGNIKVADFGFAIQLTKEQQKRKSVVGTPAWMAPELINKNFYNELVDVWSAGVILIQLIEGEPPYLRLPPLKAMYFISTKDSYRLNKQKYSAHMCDFVQKCLEKDLKKRWSIKKLLQHPFITQIGSGAKEREIFADMVKNKKDASLSQLMSEQ